MLANDCFCSSKQAIAFTDSVFLLYFVEPRHFLKMVEALIKRPEMERMVIASN